MKLARGVKAVSVLDSRGRMQSSRIDSILRSARELREPVRVHGASIAAAALLLSRLTEEDERARPAFPLVALCATDDEASALASDVESLVGALGSKGSPAAGNPPLVSSFSSWEQSPYSPITPSIRTRLSRIALLDSLAGGSHPKILTTTIAALCQASIPKEILSRHTLLLRHEESVESRETLVRRLLDAGYLRVETVEDVGTFAVRGDLVDIFAPNREHPVRIELFGDLIERMREFDPGSQRASKGELRLARISPAREVLITPLSAGLLRERLKARADDGGVPRATRDPVLASVHAGVYPDHSDTWAPLAYEHPGILLDYLDPDARFFWLDELGCLQEWERFFGEQSRLAEEAPKSGLIAPPASGLFGWSDALEREIRDRTTLYLDRVQLTTVKEISPDHETDAKEEGEEDRISTSHRVYVKGNGDLARGNRHSLGELESSFQLWLKQGFRIAALASTQSQLERIRFLLEERGLRCRTEDGLAPGTISLRIGTLTEGFRWPAEGLVAITDAEILGARASRKISRSVRFESGSAAKNWAGLQALSDLSVGDAVVHVDHGIGIYRGLSRLDLSGAPSDFLLLEYANRDRLYLPVYRLNVVQKYSGSPEAVTLDRLGSPQFAKTKEKVKDAVKKLAVDLVQLYAERKVREGFRFSPRDASFREFEAQFSFDETPDQLKAIDDTLADLEGGKIMDRLVCGDVGYGKTEVAIRAAFRAVSDGKQVAVLVPTTVLSHQHEQSFRARLADYPVRIEAVSRFRSSKEQRATLEAAGEGKVDIVIGTHRLLSRDVRFRNLGLVIVDEEHRFGVEHKERLKSLKVNTAVLTLTATPIPRTLHMALAGLRDISLISTPPVDRLPIRTYVSKYDDALVRRAIEFELSRGGQVFFLHNRVQSIHEAARRIRELVPSAQVIVGHGQMAEGELEEAMVAFYQKKANVLVCTSIIESGLDVPSANTIIINRADSFGLAQLYQIRGRVGRGSQRAYAYLLIPSEGALTEDAKKRLEVIQRFVELGSGFSIASHDLEIRGGGDLLGPQQSGHIAAVGFDLYTELLEEAIHELQGKPVSAEESRREPEIKAPFPAFLGENFVPDVHQRLSLYRRLSATQSDAEIDQLEEELRDRFGAPPPEAQNLVWLIRTKLLLKRVGIDALTVGSEKVSLLPGVSGLLDPTRAVAMVSANPSRYQLTPDSKFVAKVPTGSLRDLFFALEGLFKDLLPRS